jgi:hypothetical protein
LQNEQLSQDVEGVDICLTRGDRIEKRVLLIEGASGSRFKGIADKRSNRSPAREDFHAVKLPGFRDWHDDDPFHRKRLHGAIRATQCSTRPS